MVVSVLQSGLPHSSTLGCRSHHCYFLSCPHPQLWSRVPLALLAVTSTHLVLTSSSGPADSPQEASSEGHRLILQAEQPGAPGCGGLGQTVRLSMEETQGPEVLKIQLWC